MKAIKPPIGVMSRGFYEKMLSQDIHFNGGIDIDYLNKKRVADIKGAMTRYLEVNKIIPLEWVCEYNEKVKGYEHNQGKEFKL